jgi:hypothetical protein
MEYFCSVIDIVAVIVAGYALWDVRKLFQHLEERDRTTEERVRIAFIKELQTTTMSMATFYRACQYIDFNPLDPDRDTSFAMLMTFRSYELLNPQATKEEKEQWRKNTREQMEKGAKEYSDMLIKSDLGKVKPGFEPSGK